MKRAQTAGRIGKVQLHRAAVVKGLGKDRARSRHAPARCADGVSGADTQCGSVVHVKAGSWTKRRERPVVRAGHERAGGECGCEELRTPELRKRTSVTAHNDER